MGLWVSIVRECIQLQCGYWRGSHSHFWHLSSSAVCGTLVITVTLQQAPFFQSFPIPTTHSGHTVAWVIFFNMQIWFRHSSYFFFFFNKGKPKFLRDQAYQRQDSQPSFIREVRDTGLCRMSGFWKPCIDQTNCNCIQPWLWILGL